MGICDFLAMCGGVCGPRRSGLEGAEHLGQVGVAEADADLGVDVLAVGLQPGGLRADDVVGGQHALLETELRVLQVGLGAGQVP